MNTVLRSSAARRRLILALVGVLAIPTALPLGTATASHFSDTEELSAEDNIGAAIAYSTTTFTEPVEEAVLGRDDVFADSLASGLLQGTRPLLLTTKDALAEPVKAELARLSPSVVHVLGGEAAIEPVVVQALEAEGYTVQRHSGPTRIDTAVEIAKALGASATKAILARANGTPDDETRGFADSLAAGGWAADTAMPVLLTETEKLSDPVATYLGDSSITEIFVVGGQSAVSEAVVTQLTAMGMTVKRVSGPTRFHTALAIAAERGFSTASDATKVIVTEGQAADAWAAGFAAAGRSAKDDAPIVLAVGTEIPEPTMTFLSGGGGEPEPDPSESPSPDPSESPTPDPSESPAPGEGRAALLCAPKLATEACDAAATALGQVAGGGEQIVTFAVTAISRFDHAIGKVVTPAAANGLAVSGCGYTDEPIYMENDGTFYLMMAGDPGTCAAEFAVTTSAGVLKQTVELTIGDTFTPPSALGSPELVVVRPVKADDEGVHVRFVFDEPIAPAPAIDPGKFHLFDYRGKPNDSAAFLPSAVFQDPRNPRAVIAVFASSLYEDATVAVARGGYVCATAAIACANATQRATNNDFVIPGAVRDLDKFPNPTGHFGLRTLDRTESSSDAPDLLSVGDYRASDSSLLFEFSEDVTVPSPTAAGDATVLLKDGTLKQSDQNGFSAGPTANTLRVSFSQDGLGAAEMESARRAIVKTGRVEASGGVASEPKGSTPVAVIIAGGGISDRPDFVDVENATVTGTGQRTATFVFEEDLDFVDATEGVNGKFAAVLANGKVAYPEPGTGDADPALATGSKREVVVNFHEPGETTVDGNVALDDTVLYYTVLTDAVRAFASQKTNFADTIRISTPIIYTPGETKAPDLDGVRARFVAGEAGTAGLGCTNHRFELRFEFDANIVAVTNEFHVWYWKAADNSDPRVDRLTDLEFASNSSNVGKTYQASNTQANGACPNGQLQPADPFTGGNWGARGQLVKYLAVESRRVEDGGNASADLMNYAAGMRVPN